MTGRLQNKAAVVTGAASGMGAAMAHRFRAEGAEVILTDVQKEKGEAVARACGGIFIAHDVSTPEGWDAVGKLVDSKFGRLDILVNNAGIMSGQSIETTDMATWRRVLGVNLDGPMLGAQMAIPRMRKDRGGKGGAIINIASTTSYAALAGDLAYTSSKSAVRLLTKSIAVWCARNGTEIRCNSIHPGATRTAITDPFLDAAPDREAALGELAAMSPFNRIGQPEDIAAVATFLASDEASFVTGSEYLCDGGCLAAHPGGM
ncbi:MAG: glucose 1-dehydrogenase [Caulobacterales bacterium]